LGREGGESLPAKNSLEFSEHPIPIIHRKFTKVTWKILKRTIESITTTKSAPEKFCTLLFH
jgi:hypothetical protein